MLDLSKQSDYISNIFYNSNTNQLYVFFKNRTLYVYDSVPPVVVNDLRQAEDKGQYFYRNIREGFTFHKLY